MKNVMRSNKRIIAGFLLVAALGLVMGCNIPLPPLSLDIPIPPIALADLGLPGVDPGIVYADLPPISDFPSEEEIVSQIPAGLPVGIVSVVISDFNIATDPAGINLDFLESIEIWIVPAGGTREANGTLVATATVGQGGGIEAQPEGSFDLLAFIRENGGQGDPFISVCVNATLPDQAVTVTGSIRITINAVLNPV